MRYFKTLLILLFIASQVEVVAQNFPVQATTQLIPPYSVYLTDYASPESQKLRVILVQRDLTQPSYQLRLVVNIELNGNIIMRTSRLYRPAPISLDPGIPTVISGADLFPYLDSRNLDFVGYSRDQYERTKALPEGSYRISFTAYDYQRQEVQVSNEGSSFYWLAKNEPPLINFPACGTRVPLRDPQQIVFSWLPRNTTSPNSAAETQYEFALYEVRPAGRNPNDVVLTTPPMFRTTTDYTQLVFGPAEPLLLEGMSYVWRVQAQDKNGRDAFRNNGYSEVCYFNYGGADPGFEVGIVQGLQAQGESERRAKIWWQTGVYDNYRIEYRKVGKDYEWFKSAVSGSELKLFDLEPNTEYEARMQAGKEGVFGPYTDIVKFRTTPMRVAQCGQPTPQWPNTPGRPLPSAITGMFVNARGMEMQLTSVQALSPDGWYRGTGRIAMPFLAGANFTTQFERIYIDENRNVTNGHIDFVSRGVAAMVEDQLAGQANRQKEAKKKQNRDDWKDTDFYEKVFKYDNPITSVVVGDNGNIVTYDNLNTMSVNKDIAPILTNNPGKAIVIEDKNGDQWVVQKDKTTGETKVTKVEGGGLNPTSNIPITSESIALIKEAIKSLRKEYDDSKIKSLQAAMTDKSYLVDQHLKAKQSEYTSQGSAVNADSKVILLGFELMSGEAAQSNSTFDQLSLDFKKAELDFNRAIVIKWLANDFNNKQSYEMVAQGLSINGQNAEAYIQDQKKQGKTNEQLVNDIKQGIITYVTSVLSEKLYGKL
jgi:TANFOR domain-containing protein